MKKYFKLRITLPIIIIILSIINTILAIESNRIVSAGINGFCAVCYIITLIINVKLINKK